MDFSTRYPGLPPLGRWVQKYRTADYANTKNWSFKITGDYDGMGTVMRRITRIQATNGWNEIYWRKQRVYIHVVKFNHSYDGLNEIWGAVHFHTFQNGRYVRMRLATNLLLGIRPVGIKVWPLRTYSRAWDSGKANIRKMAIARMSGTGPIAPPIRFDPDLWRRNESAAPAPAPVRRPREDARGGGRKRPRVDVFYTEQE